MMGGLTIFSRPGRMAVWAGLGHLHRPRAGGPASTPSGARSWRQPVQRNSRWGERRRSAVARSGRDQWPPCGSLRQN